MQTKPDHDLLLFSSVEDCVKQGESVLFKVKGTSMLPILRNDRDLVQFSPFYADSLKAGDIVLFRYHGRFIMHRIRKREGEKLSIQGDGVLNNREFPMVDDVVAIVSGIIRVDKKGQRSKMIPCTSFCFRSYSALWRLTPRPLKRFILHFCRLK